MSGSVVLQSDVGNLGLQGLGAFTNILATLSADNVAPMAMIQMEKLGATLPVSGKHAESVKGLLQRCNNVRLDRIALVIGWRKNDSASAMAQSAGGQAIALLSMCLTNLFSYANTGRILSRLCSKLCPSTANVSSMPQLASVATLLGSKVDAIGFGNLLAHEVMRIQETYAALGYSSAPSYLLEPLSIEVVTDMLESVSRALLHENQICRISGSHGMGHVVGMLQILFPRDTSLTIEGVVMQHVEHPKIRCEIEESKQDAMIRIHVETSISHTMPVNLPITHQNPSARQDKYYGRFLPYNFVWSGWLADYLRLVFTEHNLTFDGSILEACCNLLIHLPASIAISVASRSSVKPEKAVKLPAIPLLALLGPFPRERMCSILQIILGCRPTENHLDLESALGNLIATLEHAVGGRSCRCYRNRNLCDWTNILESLEGTEYDGSCLKASLIIAMRKVLNFGLLSLFIDSGPTATIRPSSHEVWKRLETPFAETGIKTPWIVSDLKGCILQMVKRGHGGSLATSGGSSTIYPSVLTTPQIPSCQLVTFSIVDGLICHEQRYYTDLDTGHCGVRSKNKKARLMEDMVPSHTGVHSGSALLTIREAYDRLKLQCSVQYAGFETKIDLKDVICGFVALKWSGTCSHPFDTPLNVEKYPAVATDVAAPTAESHLGVAMTRRSPTAQFLCCQNQVPAILQRNCCLNCAAEALGDPKGIIIVG